MTRVSQMRDLDLNHYMDVYVGYEHRNRMMEKEEKKDLQAMSVTSKRNEDALAVVKKKQSIMIHLWKK